MNLSWKTPTHNLGNLHNTGKLKDHHITTMNRNRKIDNAQMNKIFQIADSFLMSKL